MEVSTPTQLHQPNYHGSHEVDTGTESGSVSRQLPIIDDSSLIIDQSILRRCAENIQCHTIYGYNKESCVMKV